MYVHYFQAVIYSLRYIDINLQALSEEDLGSKTRYQQSVITIDTILSIFLTYVIEDENTH